MLSRRWSDVIDLVAVTGGKDSSGFAIEEKEVIREGIFCNKKDVRSSEFHQAAAQGKLLDAMFEVQSIDYEKEGFAIHEGVRYAIERTYDRGEKIELVCQSRGVANGD